MNIEGNSIVRRLAVASRGAALALAALLGALQAFAALDVAHAEFAGFSVERGAVVALSADCGSSAASDGNLPTRHHHAPKCVFCLTSAYGETALLAPFCAGAVYPRASVQALPKFLYVAVARAPSASARPWSSRAPPFFS